MKKILLVLLFCLPIKLCGSHPYCIVYVHIGDKLPSYLEISLAQARLFNPTCPIILIANEMAIEGFLPRSDITFITCESLPRTSEHEEFCKKTKLNNQILDGYWRYTSERFLYLYDYMAVFDSVNLFHIENDVLLYTDLEKLLPLFNENYPYMATTFESELKCIAGFVFISNKEALQSLANYFAMYASKAMTDMQLLAQFWKEHPRKIDCLPMIMESYLLDHLPPNLDKRSWRKKQQHCNYVTQFNSIFDGATLGVFFDGLDKGDYPPGYIMGDLFNPSLFEYQWPIDNEGRKVPHVIYKNEMYRLNNLHIASKRLERFTSKSWPW